MKKLFNTLRRFRSFIWSKSRVSQYFQLRYRYRTYAGLLRGYWSSLCGRVLYSGSYRRLVLGPNIDFDMWADSAIEVYGVGNHQVSDPANKIFPTAISIGTYPHYEHINISMAHPTRLRIRNNAKLSMEPYTCILIGCYIAIAPHKNIHIGADTYIAHGVVMNIRNGLTIGRNVMIGHESTIMDYDGHPVFYSQAEYNQYQGELYGGKSDPILIEDNVWIGFRTTILKGVTIGSGSIVGANSCVVSDVPPNSIVAGNPARLIKENIIWSKY
jgi:acetyltransferase-like isoleucine patch superfamily enzyme